ncbi:MAG TPA: hypothetical protein VKB30_02950 [Candidatus Limnocylindrales bacterium]|nr:hypothetical protein [Candidatus Limnocylindrales bacterium]
MVHRRPLGNGRRLAIVGSILVMIGCLLPWYVLGGDGGLPQQVYRAFDGSGIVSFLAALATLALVVLPYAAGPRPVSIDRGLAYGLLAIAALVGVALWLPNVIEAPEGLLPDRAYGWWISAIGGIVMARGAFEVSQEPARR